MLPRKRKRLPRKKAALFGAIAIAHPVAESGGEGVRIEPVQGKRRPAWAHAGGRRGENQRGVCWEAAVWSGSVHFGEDEGRRSSVSALSAKFLFMVTSCGVVGRVSLLVECSATSCDGFEATSGADTLTTECSLSRPLCIFLRPACKRGSTSIVSL